MFEQNRERNLSMVMDFYEMTMSNGYFRDGVGQVRAAFDVFYRKNPDEGGFAIFAGLEQVIDYLDDNIDFVLDFLKTRMPKVRVRKPEGTYILWMDFRDYGLSAQEIHKRIYVDANVMLEGGPQFDPERGAGFERMCLCTRRSLLKEALERIAAQFPEP